MNDCWWFNHLVVRQHNSSSSVFIALSISGQTTDEVTGCIGDNILVDEDQSKELVQSACSPSQPQPRRSRRSLALNFDVTSNTNKKWSLPINYLFNLSYTSNKFFTSRPLFLRFLIHAAPRYMEIEKLIDLHVCEDFVHLLIRYLLGYNSLAYSGNFLLHFICRTYCFLLSC